MKVVVAYDGSPCADSAIEDMQRAGLPSYAEGLIISVSDGERDPHGAWTGHFKEAEARAETARNRIRSYFPNWVVFKETLWGAPAKVILDLSNAWHADLIVAGSHGRSLSRQLFLGSVSMDLVHKAECSVRVARAGTSRAGPIRILIGHDGSAQAQAAVRSVASRTWSQGTEARIVSVVETLVPAAAVLEGSTYPQDLAVIFIREVDEKERIWLQKTATEAADSLHHSGLIVAETVIEGDPRQAIITEADNWSADTIFVGARGLGRVQRLFLGSVSSYIAKHAHCTVEVVR
jgi:nucleotide-binding universal stress UspA family protein